MLGARVIPCLLFRDESLVKTIKFKSPIYIGDPINAVKIFNDKEVDELVILDIMATREKRAPNFNYIKEIAGECFMPLAYGGGITSLSDIEELAKIGVEKVILSSFAVKNHNFLKAAVREFGSSTIVVCLDVKVNFWGKYGVYTDGGRVPSGEGPISIAKELEEIEVGELIVNSIDRDGTFKGYDLKLLKQITDVVNMPVVACGGAGSIEHFRSAITEGHVSAVAAGSFFVFHGPHKAVLIQYPSKIDIDF